MAEKAFEYDFARIWLDEENIIRLVYAAGVHLDLRAAQQGNFAIRSLSGGEKRLILVDARGLRNVDREVRQYSVGTDAATPWIQALATLTNPVSRVLGELFNKMNRPSYPIRFFTSEEEALAWLRGQSGFHSTHEQ